MFLVLNPETLTAKAVEPHSPETATVPLDIELEVGDRKRHYDGDYGYGFFISEYIHWLGSISSVYVSDDDEELNSDVFDLIREDDPELAARLIAFTNEWYEYWRDHVVTMVDDEKAEREVRQNLCEDCTEDHAWDITYGEYDGPDPDEAVSEREDVMLQGLTLLERVAIIRRNNDRRDMRDNLAQDREDVESEVVNREFACRNNCDNFYEDKSTAEEETRDAKVGWLLNKWRKPIDQTNFTHINSELLGSFHTEDDRAKPVRYSSLDFDSSLLRGLRENTTVVVDNEVTWTLVRTDGVRQTVTRDPIRNQDGMIVSEGDMIRDPLGAEANVQQLLRAGYVTLGVDFGRDIHAANLEHVNRQMIIVDEFAEFDPNQLPPQQTAQQIRATVEAAHERFNRRVGRRDPPPEPNFWSGLAGATRNLLEAAPAPVGGIEHWIRQNQGSFTPELFAEAMQALTSPRRATRAVSEIVLEMEAELGRQNQTTEGGQTGA